MAKLSLTMLGLFSRRNYRRHSYLSSWKEKIRSFLLLPFKKTKWRYALSASLSVFLFQICNQVLFSFRWIPNEGWRRFPRLPQCRGLVLTLHPQTCTQRSRVFYVVLYFMWIPGSHGKVFPNICSCYRCDPKPMESHANIPIDIHGPVPSTVSEEPSTLTAVAFPGNTEVI